MKIMIQHSSMQPIYEQIVEQIKQQVMLCQVMVSFMAGAITVKISLHQIKLLIL